MQQPSLFDSSPRIPIAGHSQAAREASAPIAPSVHRLARHCSAMGALAVENGRPALWKRMLALYASGERTDAELAALLGVRESTISARRSELMKTGWVGASDLVRKNPRTGVNNSTWKLLV